MEAILKKSSNTKEQVVETDGTPNTGEQNDKVSVVANNAEHTDITRRLDIDKSHMETNEPVVLDQLLNPPVIP